MMTTLVETLVPDELWAILAPLLPPAPRPWYGGRTRTVLDRNLLRSGCVHGSDLDTLAAVASW
jgi:hypothetical protein